MLENIRESVKKLIALYEGEKHRADSLEEQLSAAQAEAEAYRMQIAKLKRQIDNLQLSSGLFSKGGDNTDAKERIDKLIREIDKCISLMEK